MSAAKFSAPNTGADLLEKKTNRWIQREYRFALDLPEGWRPALAPSQVALLFANGPPMGIWSDNLLVLAHPHQKTDLEDLAKLLPDQLKQEDPNCQIISCKIIAQGKEKALETVVRTDRGPFSMTVIERRFRGGRFDYEVKVHGRDQAIRSARPQAPRKPRELPRDAGRSAGVREQQGGVRAGAIWDSWMVM